MKIFVATLSLPAIAIGLFITHELLEAVEADRLLWFLYWTYVPLALFLGFVGRLISNNED